MQSADGNGRGGTIITATAKAEATTASELAVTTNYARSLKQALAAAISDTNADAGAEDAFGNAMNALGGFSATEDTALAKQVAPQDRYDFRFNVCYKSNDWIFTRNYV